MRATVQTQTVTCCVPKLSIRRQHQTLRTILFSKGRAPWRMVDRPLSTQWRPRTGNSGSRTPSSRWMWKERSLDQSCPDRTRSDPSGSRFPLPGLPKKLVPRVSAVPEEQVTAAAESDSDGCGQDLSERLETYDHFSASQQPLEGYPGPHMHMSEMGMPMMAPMMVGMPQMGLDFGAWADQSHAEVLPKAHQMEGQAPPFGMLHSFHKEVRGFGLASHDLRQFTKGQDYEGRLSVISGSEVQKGGVQRYLMEFSCGELTKADGIGFVFASRVPCAKNIQKIVSVFVNQRGRICMRVFGDILKAKKHVRALQVGDWVEMVVDLENSIATFKVWPYESVASGFPEPQSIAEFNYGKRLAQAQQLASKPVKLNVGHFACVIQNVGVTVTMGSWSVPFNSVLSSHHDLSVDAIWRICWLRLPYTDGLTSRKVVEEAVPLLWCFCLNRDNMYSSVMQTNSCHSSIYRFAGFGPKAKRNRKTQSPIGEPHN